MWGFVSKQDKKVLQKVRENKDKDVETWKYMIRRESATLVSTLLLSAFVSTAMVDASVGNISLGYGILASLALVYGIINFVGMGIILTKLTSGEKEDDKNIEE